MKLVFALLFSTLIAPGIAVCMDVNYAQEERERNAAEQQYMAAQQEGQEGQDRRREGQDRQREGYDRQREGYDRQREGHDRDKDKDRTRSSTTAGGFMTEAPKKGVSVDHLIGSDVRNRSDDENIGTVDDILIGQDGRPLAAVISVGGFLGIGEKDVAVDWNDVEMRHNREKGYLERTTDAVTGTGDARDDDNMTGTDRTGDAEDPTPTDYVLVVDVTRERLENAPEFDRNNWSNWRQ